MRRSPRASCRSTRRAGRNTAPRSWIARPLQRTELGNALDVEQRAHNKTKAKDAPAHYFRMMKELSLVGYFSSEIGATQAVRYIEVPGAYHGDYPYKKGDRAWY